MTAFFSERRGLRNGCTIEEFRFFSQHLYHDLIDNGYLEEWFGYTCVDTGHVQGKGGRFPERNLMRSLGRVYEWPPEMAEQEWSEDAIFDFWEFLYTHVSLPIQGTGRYHSWNECGWHDREYDSQAGQRYLRSEATAILAKYGNGWCISEDGHIVELAPLGLGNIIDSPISKNAPEKLRELVQVAVDKFRRRGATKNDRLDAVRTLGDAFEENRAALKTVVGTQDTTDLFNILNNFGIRHHNKTQKSNYDAIWLTALFYHYLTMIHTFIHLSQRSEHDQTV